MLNKNIGRKGEQLALHYLQKNGYNILFVNWTCRWGEIDLVAEKDHKIIFVEVKTRLSDSKGYAYEGFTWKKKHNLMRSINIFLSQNDYKDYEWRLDLFCLDKIDNKIKLSYFPNV